MHSLEILIVEKENKKPLAYVNVDLSMQSTLTLRYIFKCWIVYIERYITSKSYTDNHQSGVCKHLIYMQVTCNQYFEISTLL